MYRFSRMIYRVLATRVKEDPDDPGAARQRLLEACETAMRRLAYDRRYFARPTRSLFGEVRPLFSIGDQTYVYGVVERAVKLAMEHLDHLPEVIEDRPRECRAYTRKGTQCAREPAPGKDFCPSHKHMEEPIEYFERRFERDAELRPGAEGVSAAA
jgi:hypothetical protein